MVVFVALFLKASFTFIFQSLQALMSRGSDSGDSAGDSEDIKSVKKEIEELRSKLGSAIKGELC